MRGKSQSLMVLAILSRAGQPTNLQSPASRPDLDKLLLIDPSKAILPGSICECVH